MKGESFGLPLYMCRYNVRRMKVFRSESSFPRSSSLSGACLLTAQAADLQVFAAASLTDALKEIAPAYEAASGDKLQFNLAGSNALARQIQEGAPADVFLSADEAKMDGLEKAGLLLDATRSSLLSNYPGRRSGSR